MFFWEDPVASDSHTSDPSRYAHAKENRSQCLRTTHQPQRFINWKILEMPVDASRVRVKFIIIMNLEKADRESSTVQKINNFKPEYNVQLLNGWKLDTAGCSHITRHKSISEWRKEDWNGPKPSPVDKLWTMLKTRVGARNQSITNYFMINDKLTGQTSDWLYDGCTHTKQKIWMWTAFYYWLSGLNYLHIVTYSYQLLINQFTYIFMLGCLVCKVYLLNYHNFIW